MLLSNSIAHRSGNLTKHVRTGYSVTFGLRKRWRLILFPGLLILKHHSYDSDPRNTYAPCNDVFGKGARWCTRSQSDDITRIFVVSDSCHPVLEPHQIMPRSIRAEYWHGVTIYWSARFRYSSDCGTQTTSGHKCWQENQGTGRSWCTCFVKWGDWTIPDPLTVAISYSSRSVGQWHCCRIWMSLQWLCAGTFFVADICTIITSSYKLCHDYTPYHCISDFAFVFVALEIEVSRCSVW